MKTFGIILARESEYCKRKNLQSPEERYQDKKRHWYFHKSSWYMRGIKSGYDGNGCNNGVCVPACRYYTQTGRIENEEVLKSYEDNKSYSEPPTVKNSQIRRKPNVAD